MTALTSRVLVADDDPTVALLMRAALGGQGFSVTVVDDGGAALAAFARARFDIVLLDIDMPDIDGFTACAAIRQRPDGAVPIVLVTGHDGPAFVERAAALGAAHIAKPVDWSRLGQQLREILAAAAR
ncbi:MAG: response regulator [Bacteroidota bacterium]